MSNSAEAFMRRALYWARRAAAEDEVPIGCVIVRNGHILAHGYNRREQRRDVSEHAELMALRMACRRLRSWRLEDCDLYVTLEPCFMCAAAIQQARVRRVYFGAFDPKAGALGSQANLFAEHPLNHVPELSVGVLAEDCGALLRDFFVELRAKNKAKVGGAPAQD